MALNLSRGHRSRASSETPRTVSIAYDHQPLLAFIFLLSYTFGFIHILFICCFLYLRNAKQLNLKDEGGASWYAWLRKLAITHFSRDIDLPFVAHTHLLHSDNPSLYKVTETYGQWSTATATVKLFAVDGATCVMCSDYASGRRMLSVCLALCQHLIILDSGFTPSSCALLISQFLLACAYSLLFMSIRYLFADKPPKQSA